MANIKDQENTSGTTGIGFGDTDNGRNYMAQGFVPSSAIINITHVSFFIKSKDGDTDVGIKAWIDTSDTNSNPDNGINGIGGVTLIGNGTLITSGVTKYTLTSSVVLTAGNQYVMVFAPWNVNTDVFESSFNDFQSSVTNPYAGSRRVHLDNNYANPTAPDGGNADILFETWGDEPVTGTDNLLLMGAG